MPSGPLTWLDDFVVNTNTNDLQVDPVITQLASGHILVIWTDTDNSSIAGSPKGYDVIGRIFDPLGKPITDEIPLNSRSTLHDEFNPTVTALDNGGFVVAYDEMVFYDNLHVETYSFDPTSATVTRTAENYLFKDNSISAGRDQLNVVIASASSTSAMAAYHTEDGASGSDQIIIRTYNPTTGAVGSEIVLLNGPVGNGENVSGPDIAALSNGNYAVAYVDQNPSPTGDSLIVAIRDQAGASVSSTAVLTATDILDPQIVALKNGYFVVAYHLSTNNGDIGFRVYANNGNALTGGGPFSAGNGSNLQNEPCIVGLADGTFIVAHDNYTKGQIIGERFSVSGQTVSIVSKFVIDDTGGHSIKDIEMAGLADGRFSVTWSDGTDIRMKILDTRDFVNNPAVYNPEPNWQVGTVGNDVFTTDGDAYVVHGWTGNDDITQNAGSGGTSDYHGDAGSDTLRVTTAIDSDKWDGGYGNDTIDWSAATIANGADFDLALGTAKQGAMTEVMVGFENIVGSAFDDTLHGTGGANKLAGGAGNDVIYGGIGNDTVVGNDGNDYLYGDAGADYLSGGTGNDRAVYNNNTSGVTVSLTNPSINTGDAAGDTYNSVENVSGSKFNDNIYGNAGANAIHSGAGNDVVNGYAGNDILTGGTGDDKFVFTTALNATTNMDKITDFVAADDTIQIDNAVFIGLAAGVLAASAFKDVTTGAKDASDRILYNSDTGGLFYDRDGSGSSYAAVKFGWLTNTPVLTAADFFVI